jgi:hypothetical protein
MPRVSRVMKKEADDLPRVGPTDLGIRSVDVDVDTQNHVIVNGKGMSVAPTWRDININRIPKRLRPIMPGAGGANSTFCFRIGSGPFLQGSFANALGTRLGNSRKHSSTAECTYGRCGDPP